MEAKISDFSRMLLDSPKNCWLALNEEENKVVGSGPTFQEAVSTARMNGVEDPLLIWSPQEWSSRIF
jgi:hypothetical protein